MKNPLFKIGDHVEIVEYGQLLWMNINDKFVCQDLRPELIGQVGIVSEVSEIQESYYYAIKGISKFAWYDQEQLKIKTIEDYEKAKLQ